MRLELTEESMYRRMDLKDYTLMMILLSGITASLGLILLSYQTMLVPGAAMLAASFIGICGCMRGYIWLKHKIMPVTGCFLEIQTACFVAVQPYWDSRYESCRIYYKDVEEVVRGAKNKGFYIRVSQTGESVIQGNQNVERKIMFISAFGYSKEGIEKIYEMLKARIPKTAGFYEPGQ